MNLDPWTVLAHIVNFIILFIFLRWVLYKPVVKMLRARQDGFRQQQEKLDAGELQIEKMQNEYQLLIDQAQQKSIQQLQKSSKDANEIAQQIVEKAQAQAEGLLMAARQEIEKERKQSLEKMREEVLSMATEMAEFILAREITQQDQQRLIEEFMLKLKG